MKLDDFREEMMLYRQTADSEARSLKDPYVVLDRLHQLYVKFDGHEREMANNILSEWVLSEDAGLRFDAQALIDDFHIATAIPALQSLATRLSKDTAPGAPYELKKVNRIVERLNSKKQNTA
jgi:hypothetical protein